VQDSSWSLSLCLVEEPDFSGGETIPSKEDLHLTLWKTIPQDMIITCREIVTMTGGKADWLAVEDGKISRLGIGDLPEDPGREMVAIPRGVLVPGFIDTHTHFLQTGLNLDCADLTGASSIDDLIEILSASAEERETWIFGHGFDESTFIDKRYPQAADIDRAFPDRPVFLSRRDHHSGVANSKALSLLKVPKSIDSDETRRGIFRGEANWWIRARVYRDITLDDRKRALDKAAAAAVSRGITTVHALEGGSLFGNGNIDIVLDHAPSLPLDVLVYPQTEDVDWVLSRGLTRIGGCLLIDGSFGSRTAALWEPYADSPGEKGLIYYTIKSLSSLVKRAHRKNLQISFHAIGDRAIRLVCDAYREAISEDASWDCRHRIEHCELPDPREIEIISALNLHLGVQPAFETLWGGEGKMYEMRLGAERARRTNPFATFISMGIPLGGGSDSDVTPMDPMLGIWSAVLHPTPEHRISRELALSLFTSAASWMAFQEERKGTIEEGKDADFAILSANPLTVEADELRSIRVLRTYVRGRLVYEGTKS
jgi:predicted amidohydrolase YtcJ